MAHVFGLMFNIRDLPKEAKKDLMSFSVQMLLDGAEVKNFCNGNICGSIMTRFEDVRIESFQGTACYADVECEEKNYSILLLINLGAIQRFGGCKADVFSISNLEKYPNILRHIEAISVG